MEAVEVFKRLEGIKDLPTLPVIIEKLRAALRDARSDAARIAGIIEDDPAIMAKVLRVVNSALYGTTEQINSLQLAISRLGFNATYNIAVSTGVLKAFRGAGNEREEYWRHCISTGLAACAVMRNCRTALAQRYEMEYLHLAGLLHDIGKMVFFEYFGEEYQRALRLCASEKIPLFQAERRVFNTDHTAVGAWLGKRWKLPEPLVETILWHHQPARAKPEVQEAVRLCEVANYICNFRMIGNGGDFSAPACSKETWQLLGLDDESYYAIINEVSLESEKSEVLLSLT